MNLNEINKELTHKIVFITNPNELSDQKKLDEFEKDKKNPVDDDEQIHQSKILAVQFGTNWMKFVLNKLPTKTYLITKDQLVKSMVDNYFMPIEIREQIEEYFVKQFQKKLEDNGLDGVDVQSERPTQDSMDKFRNYVYNRFNGLMEFGMRFNEYENDVAVNYDREMLDNIVDKATSFMGHDGFEDNLEVALIDGKPYGCIDIKRRYANRMQLEKTIDPMIWFGVELTNANGNMDDKNVALTLK